MSGLPVALPKEVGRFARSVVQQHRVRIAAVLVVQTAAAAFALAGPAILGYLVQSVQSGTTGAQVSQVVGILAICVIGQATLVRWARFRSYALGEQILAEVREGFLERALNLPLATLEESGSGDLVNRTTNDIDTLSRTVRYALPETVSALIFAAASLLGAILTSPTMAACALLPLPVIALSTRWYLRRATRAYLAEREAYSRLTGITFEMAEGARALESLGLQSSCVADGDRGVGDVYDAERRTLRLRCRFFPTIESSYVVPAAATLFIGGLLYANGQVTLGQVTAVTLYMQQLVDPVEALMSWLDQLQLGSTALARLVGVTAVGSRAVDRGIVPATTDLVASHVSFSYDGRHEVLHDVSLAVRSGEQLAVVGPTGAGKSTLARLFAGIDRPSSGCITLGGVAVHDIALENLRGLISLVSQEGHVFAASIADNVRMGRPDATAEQVRSALAAVGAIGWTDALPLAEETPVGQGGAVLSPSQAQQLALARLVLVDPHTLILDEATAMMDPRAARRLEQSLAALLSGRTVIAIAHRLESAHQADRIVVIESGRVAETGTHNQLIADGGPYASLWRSWHSGT